MFDLADLRKRAGYSQLDVSHLLEVDQSAVSHWERKLNGIAYKYKKKLANLYGVSIEEIETAWEGE